MKGQENLIPFSERTEDEHRDIATKGGKASGRARRQKANLKKAMETVLALNIPDKKVQQQLEALGLDPTMENGLILSVTQKAMQRGDHKALQTIRTIIGQDVTLADRQEQSARTKRLKAETEKIEAEVAIKTGSGAHEAAQSQIQAIADMINSPAAERTLRDFMGGNDVDGSDSNENSNTT